MTTVNTALCLLPIFLASETVVRCDPAAALKGGALPPTKEQIAQFPYKPRPTQPRSVRTRVNTVWKRENFEDRYTLKNALDRYPKCLSIGQIWLQGPCETCYAVATISAYTDRMCIANGGASNTYYSASQAVACTYPARTPDQACSTKGFVHEVQNHIVAEGVASGGRFITDDGCVPYGIENKNPAALDATATFPPVASISCRKKCKKAGDNMARETASADHAWIKVLEQDTPEKRKEMEKFIKDEIFAEGPVVTNIKLHTNFLFWDFEHNGPYSTESTKVAVAEMGYHSVRIIGWDKWTDPVASKAQGKTVEVPYWIIANTYGTGYHMGGFAWIKMGENAVNVETHIHGIRIHFDNPMYDKPPTCESSDFNTNAVFDLGVPVDAADTSAPFQLIKGGCTQKMKVTKEGVMRVGPALPVQYVYQNAPPGRLSRYQLTEAPRKLQYFHGDGKEEMPLDKPIGFPQHEARVMLYNEKGEGVLCKRVTDDRFICEDTKEPLAAPYKDHPTAAYYTEDDKAVCSLNSWWMNSKSPAEFQHNHYAMTGMQIHQTDITASVKGVALFNDLDSVFTLIYLESGRFAVLGQKNDKNPMNGLLTYQIDNSNPFVNDGPTNIKMSPLVIA